jgi:hypothetical protein
MHPYIFNGQITNLYNQMYLRAKRTGSGVQPDVLLQRFCGCEGVLAFRTGKYPALLMGQLMPPQMTLSLERLPALRAGIWPLASMNPQMPFQMAVVLEGDDAVLERTDVNLSHDAPRFRFGLGRGRFGPFGDVFGLVSADLGFGSDPELLADGTKMGTDEVAGPVPEFHASEAQPEASTMNMVGTETLCELDRDMAWRNFAGVLCLST